MGADDDGSAGDGGNTAPGVGSLGDVSVTMGSDATDASDCGGERVPLPVGDEALDAARAMTAALGGGSFTMARGAGAAAAAAAAGWVPLLALRAATAPLVALGEPSASAAAVTLASGVPPACAAASGACCWVLGEAFASAVASLAALIQEGAATRSPRRGSVRWGAAVDVQRDADTNPPGAR